MIKFIELFIFFIVFVQVACAQVTSDRPYCSNPNFDKKVSKTINFSIPTIGVDYLKDIQSEVYIFDTRKRVEYEVSHIPGAKYLGYHDFDINRIGDIPKDARIVLYCSIGYRSEKIGEKLRKIGYTNVYNLYGSIFDWINRGNAVVDKNGQPTKRVHTYNRNWSKWVDGQKVEKIW